MAESEVSSELIRIGVVGRAHGIRGEIRVFLDEPGSNTLLRVKRVYLDGVPYEVNHAVRCGRFVALALNGINDRDAAFALTGCEVFVERASLRRLRDAYYACDLAGMALVDEQGRRWGVVKDIVAGCAHDLLHYERVQGGMGFVPFVSAHVGEVDLEAKIVTVESEWMAQLDAVYGDG